MLQPQVIARVVSRVRKNQGRLPRWFGLTPDNWDPEQKAIRSPNSVNVAARYGVYRIYNNVRTAAMARAPATGPATYKPNPVGEVNYSIARFHEKIRLDWERLGNLSPVA